MFALHSGSYNESEFFPHSRSAAVMAPGKRVGELCDRYKPLKAVDITPETQSRYEIALDICVDTLGRKLPKRPTKTVRAVHAESAIAMAHDVDAAIHAMTTAFGLADNTLGLFDFDNSQQLAAHQRGSSSAVTLAKARVHSRAMSA